MVLESDSTEAIDFVLGSGKGNKEDQRAIDDCKELISRDWVLTIKHIGREANRVADQVAKWSARQEVGTFELLHRPQYLVVIMEEEEGERELT